MGTLVAKSLKERARLGSRLLYTAGGTVIYKEVDDIVQKVSGREVSRETWSIAKLKRDLENDSKTAIEKYRVVFAGGAGLGWPVKKTYNLEKEVVLEGLRS